MTRKQLVAVTLEELVASREREQALQAEVERLRGVIRSLRSEMFVCREEDTGESASAYDWVIGRIDALSRGGEGC